MRVKICGLTRPEDARCAAEAGADAVGIVMFSDSPRSVPPATARALLDIAAPFVTRVIVSHTASRDELAEILMLRPDAVQLSHPFERRLMGGARLIRVVGRGDPVPGDCDAVVLDESRGGGRAYDPAYAGDLVRRSPVPVILAGGLTPGNVAAAAREVAPYAVDVASGVEVRPGIKDHDRIRSFVRAAKGAGI